jgi:Cdc6-like AAA superfamily ATPase
VDIEAHPPSKWLSYSRVEKLLVKLSKDKINFAASQLIAESGGSDVSLAELVRIVPKLLGGASKIETAAELLGFTFKPNVEQDAEDLTDPIGVWIVGAPGTGKTTTCRDILETINNREPKSVYFMTSGRSGGLNRRIASMNDGIKRQ